MILGICGANITEENIAGGQIGYEIDRLSEEGSAYYDEVILIEPRKVVHIFDPHHHTPQVKYGERDISLLNTCIFRSISGAEESISLLARNLQYCGCDILDPPERFSGAPSGKLFDALKGFRRKIMPETYFAFNQDSAINIIEDIKSKNIFPVVLKPGKGSRGENVVLAKSSVEALDYILRFYHDRNKTSSSVIIQKYIEIEEEFRGIVLGGRCLGLAKKIPSDGRIARNAAQGGKFTGASDREISMFVEENASNKGLVGVDVARDKHGRIHYIESNRSPQWKNFEEATGINIARILIEYAYQLASKQVDLFLNLKRTNDG